MKFPKYKIILRNNVGEYISPEMFWWCASEASKVAKEMMELRTYKEYQVKQILPSEVLDEEI